MVTSVSSEEDEVWPKEGPSSFSPFRYEKQSGHSNFFKGVTSTWLSAKNNSKRFRLRCFSVSLRERCPDKSFAGLRQGPLFIASAAILSFLPNLWPFPLLIISALYDRIIFLPIYHRVFLPGWNDFFHTSVAWRLDFPFFFVCFLDRLLSALLCFIPDLFHSCRVFLPKKLAYLIGVWLPSYRASLSMGHFISTGLCYWSSIFLIVLFFCTTIGIWASGQLRNSR